MKATEEYLREVMMIFFMRKKIILGVTLGMFVSAILITLLWPRTYTVAGSILVKNRQLSKSPQAIESTETRVWEVDQATMTTEMKILTSPELVRSTLVDLNEEGRLIPGDKLDPEAVENLADSLSRTLTATVVPASNIIELTLRGGRPKEIRNILDSLMENYIAYRSGIYNPNKAPGFYKDEANSFRKNLQDMDKSLVNLAGKVNSAEPGLEIQNNLELRKNLEQQQETLKQERENQLLNIKYLQENLSKKNLQFFSSVDNHSVNLLSDKMQEVYIEKTNSLRIFTETSDQVKGIDEQLQTLYAALKQEVQSYIESLQNKVAVLDKQLSMVNDRIRQLTERNIELHKIMVTQQRLKNESQVLEQSYKVFATRSEEARISSSTDLDSLFSISILAKPQTPVEPTFPNGKIVIPVGLLAGFLLGMSLGFIMEYFDYTFKSPSDTLQYAGLGTLFSIPDWSVRRS